MTRLSRLLENYNYQRKDPSKASLARKDAKSDMNTLASLFLVFKQIALDQQFAIMVEQRDMLNHHHFELLCEATEKCSKSENGKLKHGLKLNIQNLLKTTCKVMKAHYQIKDQIECKQKIEDFEAVMRLREQYIFGDALYTMKHRRAEVQRRPGSLPTESVVQAVRDYLLIS